MFKSDVDVGDFVPRPIQCDFESFVVIVRFGET